MGVDLLKDGRHQALLHGLGGNARYAALSDFCCGGHCWVLLEVAGGAVAVVQAAQAAVHTTVPGGCVAAAAAAHLERLLVARPPRLKRREPRARCISVGVERSLVVACGGGRRAGGGVGRGGGFEMSRAAPSGDRARRQRPQQPGHGNSRFAASSRSLDNLPVRSVGRGGSSRSVWNALGATPSTVLLIQSAIAADQLL